MKFKVNCGISIILMLYMPLQCKGKDLNLPVERQEELRQTNFFEWLISILQWPPFNVTPPPVTVPTLAPTKPNECAACSCGTPNTIHRIVGGEETQELQYPWMALLMTNGSFYCGGTLISNLYVVTAAHCLRNFVVPLLSVRFLVHDRRANRTKEIDRRVSQTTIHEGYNGVFIYHDIGVIKLAQPVEMSDILRPVCMPSPDKLYTDEMAIVAGWGATSEGGHVANALMQVSVPIISNEACTEKYDNHSITDYMLCAGYDEGNKDACQGDSGGPLHVFSENLNIYHLVGVVSWGDGCARPNKPGVYTRVTKYLKWLERHTIDSCKCQIPTKKKLS